MSFAINRSVVLRGIGADEFRLEQWACGEDGAAVVESNYRFLAFLAGPMGCIRNVFAKVELRCLLAVTICRLEFEQDEERGVVVKAGVTSKPQDGILVSVREVVWGRIFRLFLEYLSRDGGRTEATHQIMDGHSTLSLLSYNWQ